MITCKDFNKFLEDYPDFDPELEEKNAFLSHLSECPQCKRTFEIHMEIAAKIKKSGQVSPPPKFGQTVMSEILKPSPPDSDAPPKGPGLLVAAGVSIAILSGGIFLAYKSLPSHQAREVNIPAPSTASQSSETATGSPTSIPHGWGGGPQAPGWRAPGGPDLATSTKFASQGTSLDKNPD